MSDSEQWYVHILGPDDVEGPFASVDGALTFANEVNAWPERRKGRPITEATPIVWAVVTNNRWGVTNAVAP